MSVIDCVSPELQETLVKCTRSTSVFGSVFLPSRFYRPWGDIHKEFFTALDDDRNRFTVIAAPRGFGKTTIDSVAFPLRKILFQQCRFVVLFSCTHAMAAQNVKNLGRELAGNQDIKAVFGELQGPIWSLGRGHLETTTGITIVAKGANQQTRGLLEGESRPDLVIIDDLEDSEPFRLGDPTNYLVKIKDWFYADLMGALANEGVRVVYVGTVLHENSLLEELLNDPEWASVRLELCDDELRTNYPAFMTTEQVKTLYAKFEGRGMADVFAREYRNRPISKEHAVFKQRFFKRWSDEDSPFAIADLDKVVIVDPAKTANTRSAYTAIVGWGYDQKTGRLYLLSCINERMHPEEIVEQTCNMAMQLGTHNIAVEVTSLHEFITYPFNAVLAKRGLPPIIELQARGNKLERIRQLAPFYRTGVVYHHPQDDISASLEAQLLSFPRSKWLDVADASAYLIELLHLGNKFADSDIDELSILGDEEVNLLELMEDSIDTLPAWHWAP
jgi:predicted phage terminase large subunit-like protein